MADIKRVIIIGGGIAGLCTAIALQQVGIETVVYERAQFGAVGAGLSLWSNAIHALRLLDVAPAVLAASARLDRSEALTADGRVLSRVPLSKHEKLYGEPSVVIHRADLHRILLDAIPPGCVQTETTCTGFFQDEQQVRVSFDGRPDDYADLLVGADGIHSILRKQLYPETHLCYAGFAVWRGIVTAPDIIAMGKSSESYGCGSRFLLFPVDRERIYWAASANTAAGVNRSPQEHKDFLLSRFRDWHSPIERLIQETPAEAILYNDILDIVPMHEWGKGRVILLGDAAHPTTPSMGQGACMAIESSIVLARCLSHTNDMAAALYNFQQERMPRTAWMTNQSRQVGAIGQMENPLGCRLRNFVMRLTPPGLAEKALEKAVGFQV